MLLNNSREIRVGDTVRVPYGAVHPYIPDGAKAVVVEIDDDGDYWLGSEANALPGVCYGRMRPELELVEEEKEEVEGEAEAPETVIVLLDARDRPVDVYERVEDVPPLGSNGFAKAAVYVLVDVGTVTRKAQFQSADPE